ncbi:MAG: hypothetical protein WCF07_03235, partial [Nitrososphaeraceae archaeon]
LWRQNQLLQLAADGFTEREIAAHLKMSDTTIRDLILLKQQAILISQNRDKFCEFWLWAERI